MSIISIQFTDIYIYMMKTKIMEDLYGYKYEIAFLVAC